MEHQNNFNKINQDFLQQIKSLREIIPFIMIFIDANNKKANKDFVDFVNQHGKKEKDEKNEPFFSFSPEDSHKVTALEENVKISSTASEILPCSLFVSLVSQFDSFIGKLIKEIFISKPEILNSSEKKLTYSKLQEIENIEEAKNHIIESEVESILRESHTNHFSWIENKLNIPLKKDLTIWPKFVELTERRNLFVHSDGIVSSQYLAICRKNNSIDDKNPKLGDRLRVTAEYFEESYKALFEISVKLTQVIWRKLLPNDLEKSDQSLNDVCFDLLKEHQFELADNLLIFASETLKKHFNEESKNIFIVNKALSLKLGGNKEKAEEIVHAKDWSASSDKFKIARWALLDDFEAVGKLMKKIGPNGEINKMSYKTWPLFQEFRKTKIFLDNFKEIFNEDYSLVETPKKLFDEILHQIKSKDKTKRLNNNGSPLEIGSIIQILSKYFPSYQFIHYKVESFIHEILKFNKNLNEGDFTKAIKQNIKTVQVFNENLIKQSPTQYLNPYTMIRHCLYLYNNKVYDSLLYDIQKESIEDWMRKNKTTANNK